MVDLPQRFIDKLYFCPMSGCWIWEAWDSANGYGKVWWEGRAHMAHRVVYTLLVGEIPEGLILDHRHCRLRACCNPGHLEPVTHQVNTLRGEAVLFA